jgi:hypothetical protein
VSLSQEKETCLFLDRVRFAWLSLGNLVGRGKGFLPHNSCNRWSYLETSLSTENKTDGTAVTLDSVITQINLYESHTRNATNDNLSGVS